MTTAPPFKGYRPGDDVGALEAWPFDNPASDYRIIEGAPQAFGRLESGGPGQATRFGIWRCTKGIFECTEQGDEMMSILAGHCRLTVHATNETHELRAGDTLFSHDGARVTWVVMEDVTNVFFGFKATGF